MRFWVRVWLLTLLALAIRAGVATLRYDGDITTVSSGDYPLYRVGAEEIIEKGEMTNSLFLVRPPLFSLLIAAVGVATWRVLAVNVLLGALIVPMTALLARRLGFDQRHALWAAAVVALDPISITVGAAYLDPSPLANLLVATMLVALRLAVPWEKHAVVWGGSGGASLGLAVLSRPESYLIWTGLSVWLLVAYRHRWRAIAAYALVAVAIIGVWVGHNARVFDHATVSTVSGFTMAFYRAASVERIGTGQPIDDVYMDITRRVEAELGNDPILATPDTRWGYHAASPGVLRAQYAVSLDIFREYPLIYLATFPVGFVRMFGMVPTLSDPWNQPTTVYLSALWNTVFTVGAGVGLVSMLAQRRWLPFWYTFLVAGYYVAGTLVVKNAGMIGRERTVLTPFMAVMFVFALRWFFGWCRSQSGAGERDYAPLLHGPTDAYFFCVAVGQPAAEAGEAA